MINKLVFRILFLFIIFFCYARTLMAEEMYDPCPIIFVHGYNNVGKTNFDLWEPTNKKFEKYFFKDNGEGKYFINKNPEGFKKDWDYLQKFNYSAMSNGDINDISDELKGYIDSVVNNTLLNDKNKKIIIVAHSMGGLVTRRFYAKYGEQKNNNGIYYKDLIKRVVFIGTPHLGSPLASGVILIDRLIPEIDKLNTSSENLFNKSYFDMNPKMLLQSLAYQDRINKIQSTKRLFNIFVNNTFGVNVKIMLAGNSEKPNPYGGDKDQPGRYNPNVNHYEGQGVSVGELCVSATVQAKKSFVGTAVSYGPFGIIKTEPLEIKSEYKKEETFLNNNSLGLPNDFKVIKGTGSMASWWIGMSEAHLIFNSLASITGLPEGNKLEDLVFGDGIVTTNSQIDPAIKAVPNKEILPIDCFHTSEPNAWQTILKAVDDPPIIRSIYCVPESYNSQISNLQIYIISKIKEYLLADIEVSLMVLGSNNLIPDSFFTVEEDEVGRESFFNKPYTAFEKRFLRQRSDDPNIKNKNNSFKTLMPGEFYVPAILIDNSKKLLTLKIKNPAGKEAEASILIQRPAISNIYPIDNIDHKQPTITARISTASTELYEEIDQAKDGIVKLKGDGTPLVKTRSVDIDLTSISMTLSGPNTGGEVNIEPILNFSSLQDITLAYTPTSDLSPGTYTVKVNGSDMWGLPAEEKTWTFQIPSKNPPIIDNERPIGEIDTQTPIISAHAYSPDGINIDLSSISMSVDGQGVGYSVTPSTGGSNISITHIPQQNLDYGKHNVRLDLKDTAGQSAVPKSWSFTIKNPNAFFEVSVPGTISRDTDFTMTVTTKNPDGTPLITYDESAAITISGDPSPTGEIFIQRINSNEWQDGVWTTSLQKYINGSESKYQLTITVEGLGSSYPNIKGSADTLVEPLYLTCENIGWYNINEDTGLWEGPFGDEESGWPVSVLKWEAKYEYFDQYDQSSRTWIRPGNKKYSGQAEIYKIQIPENSSINKIILFLSPKTTLLTFPPQGSEPFPVSSMHREAWFTSLSASSYPPYPKDIMAYYKLDIHQTSPFVKSNPRGDESLYNYCIGGMKYNCHGTDHNAGGSMVLSSYTTNWLSIDRLKSGLEINVETNCRVIYFTFYPDNFLELADSYYKDFESANSYSCELRLCAELNIGLVAGIR